MNSYLAQFESIDNKDTRFHEHPGVEFVYVVSGKLQLETRDEIHELAEGDAIYFDSAVPHGYRRMGAKRTTALVVTAGS